MAELLMRAQLKGSTNAINNTAGYKGVLVLNTDTEHLHVLSGTAGTSIELANTSDIPDISGKAEKTYVDQELATKQPIGDYATNTDLTEGLATKLGKTEKAVSAATADTATSATRATQDSAGNNINTTYATKTELTTGLAAKQPTGDYATNAVLNKGLDAKLDKTAKAESAKVADSILWSNIQNVPNNVSNAVSYISQTLTDEQKDQLVKNLDGTFLPLSGGTLTGELLFGGIGKILHSNTSLTKELVLSTQDSGGLLALRGLSDSLFPGDFILQAKSASDIYELKGDNSGNLTWKGYDVIHQTFNDIKTGNNYGAWGIKYSNGLKIVVGIVEIPSDQTTTVTFPFPLSDASYAIGVCPYATGFDVTVGIDQKKTTSVAFGKKNLDKLSNYNMQVSYIIIGG